MRLLATIGLLLCLGCSGRGSDETAGSVSEVEAGADAGSSLSDGGPSDSGESGSAEAAVSHATQYCDALTTKACRMRMTCCGEEASIDTILEVRRLADGSLAVTDRPDSESPWVVRVVVGPDGALETKAGVPEVNCQSLVDEYAETGAWETYEALDGYPCSEVDAALIRFFVMEWFYFG